MSYIVGSSVSEVTKVKTGCVFLKNTAPDTRHYPLFYNTSAHCCKNCNRAVCFIKTRIPIGLCIFKDTPVFQVVIFINGLRINSCYKIGAHPFICPNPIVKYRKVFYLFFPFSFSKGTKALCNKIEGILNKPFKDKSSQFIPSIK